MKNDTPTWLVVARSVALAAAIVYLGKELSLYLEASFPNHSDVVIRIVETAGVCCVGVFSLRPVFLATARKGKGEG